MKPFDYIVVFVSILISLAIADLTISTHKLLRAGRRVAWHWAAPACAVLAAMAVLRHFWIFWGLYHDTGPMPLWRFVPTIAVLVLLFLGAAAALPDDVPPEGIDLKAFYLGNRLYFWSITTAWLGGVALYNLVARLVSGEPIPWALEAQNAAALGLTVSMIFVRRLWWHAIGIVLLLAAVVWSWMRITVG